MAEKGVEEQVLAMERLRRFGHRGGNKKGDPPQSGRIKETANRSCAPRQGRVV